MGERRDFGYTIKNGSLFEYMGDKSSEKIFESFHCPHFKLKVMSGPPSSSDDYIFVRNYGMMTNASAKKFLGMTDATATPLFSELDMEGLSWRGNSTNHDGSMGTNEVADYHPGDKGYIVFLDGHIEDYPAD